MEDVHSEPKFENEKPMSAPVMDVVPPSNPAPDNRPNTQHVDHLPKHPTVHQDEIKTKQPTKQIQKQPTNGVGTAITATVIIVISMAAMATYAYLKTAR